MSFCGKLGWCSVFKSARWLVVFLFLMSYGCETEQAATQASEGPIQGKTISIDNPPARPTKAAAGQISVDSNRSNRSTNTQTRFDR